MGKHHTSIVGSIRERFAAAQPGQVFTPRDFLDLNSRSAIDKALSRLCREGELRKVGRGLYALPRKHPLFAIKGLGPDPALLGGHRSGH